MVHERVDEDVVPFIARADVVAVRLQNADPLVVGDLTEEVGCRDVAGLEPDHHDPQRDGDRQHSLGLVVVPEHRVAAGLRRVDLLGLHDESC